MWNSQDWGSWSWFLRKCFFTRSVFAFSRSVPNFETYSHTKSHSVGFYVIPSGQKTQKTGLEPKNGSLGGEIPCINRLFRLHSWVSTHQHHQACRSPKKKKNSADLVCALMPISNCKNQLTHHLSPWFLWIFASPIRINMLFLVCCVFSTTYYFFSSMDVFLCWLRALDFCNFRSFHKSLMHSWRYLRHVSKPEWNKEMQHVAIWWLFLRNPKSLAILWDWDILNSSHKNRSRISAWKSAPPKNNGTWHLPL